MTAEPIPVRDGHSPATAPADRIISDGFPEGWFLEDRPGAGEALLCRRSELAFGGVVCVCTRPRATPTEQWVLTAQIIAHGVEAENGRRRASPQAGLRRRTSRIRCGFNRSRENAYAENGQDRRGDPCR